MMGVVVVLMCCSVAVAAQGAPDRDAAERARIGDERTQAQRLYEERERACNERFAVTGCLETARAQRRETMDRLRHEELVLDNAQRKQRAAARAMRIREKQIAQESKPGPVVVRERPAEAPMPAPKASQTAARRDAVAASAVPRISDAQAQRNKAAFDAKQQQAIEHRAEVERRNAQRSQRSKQVAPLPVPKAASAP
jgi:colicin import membrane protein